MTPFINDGNPKSSDDPSRIPMATEESGMFERLPRSSGAQNREEGTPEPGPSFPSVTGRGGMAVSRNCIRNETYELLN